jgi:hypothetical protein
MKISKAALEREKMPSGNVGLTMPLPSYTRIAGLIEYHQAIPSSSSSSVSSRVRAVHAFILPPRIHRGPLHPKVGSSTISLLTARNILALSVRLFLVYLDIAVFIYCGQLALSLLFSRNSSTSASVNGFGSPGMACTTSMYELEWTLI